MKFLLIIFVVLWGLESCRTAPENNTEQSEIRQKVQTTPVYFGTIRDLAELNATSHYLKEHILNSPVAGYITQSKCVTGNLSRIGELLFDIKTREAKALDQSPDSLQLGLKFRGITSIRADVSGYIGQVFHQTGDFVSEGEPLASIRETGSLVFILHLPYEWNSLIKPNMRVRLKLPDGKSLTGVINNISREADTASQTLMVYLSVVSPSPIPEGLTATVYLPVETSPDTQVVPRTAVLSNETETEFWVMKMINDSTAVKEIIQPGIQYRDSIEIKSPVFSAQDEVLVTGNYAVPDTIVVDVTH